MMKNNIKTPLRLALILTILFALACCSFGPTETGILEGQVSIGPLQPVLREGEPEPTPAPEVYAAREIVVSKTNGKEVARLGISPTGWYRGDLPAGTYLIDINHLGIDMAKGLPQEVTIRADAITRLDIEIDTGIR